MRRHWPDTGVVPTTSSSRATVGVGTAHHPRQTDQHLVLVEDAVESERDGLDGKSRVVFEELPHLVLVDGLGELQQDVCDMTVECTANRAISRTAASGDERGEIFGELLVCC